MVLIARRTLLAGGLALAATPVLAAPAQPWIAYERRLRGLLSDPPDGDFDEDFEQTLRDIHAELTDLNKEAVNLAAKIQENLEELGA